MTWKRILKKAAHAAAHDLETHFDSLRYRLKQRLGHQDPVVIVPYRGFGTAEALSLKGRVLEDEGLSEATDRDTVWQNLLSMYKRFESDELPGVLVRARFQDIVQQIVTDEEGYFEVHLEPTAPLQPGQLWQEVELDLLYEVTPGQGRVSAVGRILTPPPDSAFGVISDVDDTILQTDAASLLKMARATFLHNARTRLPFGGAAAFCQALHEGPEGRQHNPFFYVSSSPWNLYDLLIDFFELHGFPEGPLLLRDLGLTDEQFIKTTHQVHKLTQIERILNTYPELPFLLLGDSGQEDPEIYLRTVTTFPGRIEAIYIRDVSEGIRRFIVEGLAHKAQTQGVPMLLVPDTAAAAEHAAAQGFIRADRYAALQAAHGEEQYSPADEKRI